MRSVSQASTSKVSDIMTRDVISVSPDAPVHEAARLMVEHEVSGLPVVDAEGRVVGIVSEGDLILRQAPRTRVSWWRLFFDDGERLARDYQKRAGTRVSEVMTRTLLSVGPDTDLATAAELLDRQRVRRLPVVAQGKLVGVVSRADLIRALAATPPTESRLAEVGLVDEMKARLAREPWASRSLVIQASDGVLSLWGLVDSDAEIEALQTMARSIPGCTGVENHLVSKSKLGYHYGG